MKVYNLASCTKVSPWVGVTNAVRKLKRAPKVDPGPPCLLTCYLGPLGAQVPASGDYMCCMHA